MTLKSPRGKARLKYAKEVKCPHYEGDGYLYKFNNIEFLFCEECNRKLLIQMIDQKKIEMKLEKDFALVSDAKEVKGK